LAFAAGVALLVVAPALIRFAASFQKFSFDASSSAAARITTWLQVLQVIGDYPVFGVGFNAYRAAVEHYGYTFVGVSSYGADGGLLFIMAMTGIVGLALYCLMLGFVILRCRAVWRDPEIDSGHRGIAIGTAAATVAMVIAATFVNALLTTFIMEILWLLWALTFVIARDRMATLARAPKNPQSSFRLAMARLP
jgi:O-antigen ligase